MTDYVFILYSCKKDIDKTNKTYEKIYNKLNETKVYIIYGDDLDNSQYKIVDDKYIVLNVDDGYDYLCDKTLCLIQTINCIFPNIKGMFKCDSDVVVNVNHLNVFMKINNIINNDFVGKTINITADYIRRSNLNDSNKHPREECIYCGGPLYFLSKKSMTHFSPVHIENTQPISPSSSEVGILNEKGLIMPSEIKKIYYEDMFVGYHLNKYNIFPKSGMSLYTDDIRDSSKLSYHNRTHHDELFVYIQGGIGNQLFQIACGMTLAIKYNKKFTLNSNLIMKNPHQNNNIERTKNTLLSIFPDLKIVDTNIYPNEFILLKEYKNECFSFIENRIEDFFNIYKNVILIGYFINYKYIPIDTFKYISIQPNDKELLTTNFTDIYFLHIRLGDFLKTEMYNINLTKYYNYCINRILSINSNARFYVCTNQYDNVLENILTGFPKNTKYIIQNKNNNDMDTLYIMSSCCGAICSNSTLSFMGTVFQKSPKNKDNIYMPYPFVKFIDGFNSTNITLDMYPDWCSVYNTLNDTIM